MHFHFTTVSPSLTILHSITTVIALFPFLCLTFSLLCVFGRMRTMAKLLLVCRYLHNVRSQSTSCKRGRCMSRCCEIRLRIACVMYTCFITPNWCPCLMRPLPCVAICCNTTTRREASNHVSFSPLQYQFFWLNNNPALVPFVIVPCLCQLYFMGGDPCVPFSVGSVPLSF